MDKNTLILIIGEFSIFHKGHIKFLSKMARFDSKARRAKNKKSHSARDRSVSGGKFYVGILGDKIIKELTALEPDIRKISLPDIKKIINSYLPVRKYFSVEENNFGRIIKKIKPDKIFILKGDKSQDFAEKYLSNNEYQNIIRYFDIRLHWRDSRVAEFKKETSKISKKELLRHQKFMAQAQKEAEKSKCWWRQVGAVAVKDGKIIFRGFNKMLPSDDECYKIGCIRDSIAPGKQPEICSVTHAEATVISLAAKDGVSLKNATLYITHFPCPACAKLVALAGFKKLVYTRGSSVFDGERVMTSRGVEIIKI